MKCPRCSEDLTVVHIDGENYEVCKSCEGMWLHKYQLNSLLHEKSGDLEMCSIDHRPHSDDHPPFKCETCNKMMIKINFLEFSDIILDYCEKCGSLWVDKGELENMQLYIKKVEEGSHDVKDFTLFNFLKKISEISYSIFN